MGVEHAVTRWYALRQLILNEITILEAQLAKMQAEQQEQGPAPEAQKLEVAEQLTAAQARLRALGPCPKPMMG